MKFELLGKTGSSEHGEIWLARVYGREEEEIKYATVKLEFDSSADNVLEREYEVMKAIGKHKNIIEYIEFGQDSSRIIEGTTP